MSAKMRHGTKHRPTRGADRGTAHERLNSHHAMPGRPEGAMMEQPGVEPMPSPVPTAPPSPGAGPMPSGGGMSMGPPGMGSDVEEQEQT